MRSELSFHPFSFLFRPFSLSYFERSTCLLRTFNMFTSNVQRVYFERSKTNTSGFFGKHIGLLGIFQGFKTISGLI